MADYGLIDLTQKILLVASAIAKLGLQNSALRFFDSKSFTADVQAKRRYYSTMFLGAVMTGSLVALLFAMALRFIPESWVDRPFAMILTIASSLILLRVLQSILWSFMRIEERTRAYNLYSILMKGATIGGVLLLLPVLGPSIRTYFTGTVVAELVIVLAICVPLIRRGNIRPSSFDFALFRAGCVFGAPLVLQELSGLILDSGDRAMVAHFLGAQALGFYSVSYGLATQLNTLLIAPLGLAILPIYMRLWTSEGMAKTVDFLTITFEAFVAAAAGLFVLSALGARDVVLLLASAKYRGADRLIPVLVAGLLMYTAQVFVCAGLIIHKKTAVMATALAVSAFLNLALNWLLLPWIGLTGAAIATLVSYGFCTVLLGFQSAKVLPLGINFRSWGIYLAAAAVAWSIPSQIALPSRILDLGTRCSLGIVLYVGTLYGLDPRVRKGAATLWRTLKERGVTGRAAPAV